MGELRIGNMLVTERACFFIAEIGSNHQGDPDLCENMIVRAAQCGVDAVKLQKRDSSMLTKTERSRPYENENSFGRTYGEHRDALDWFGKREFTRFKAVAEKLGVILFATPFTQKDAFFLYDLDFPLYKIASCDVRNIPLVRTVALFGRPMIISTGGATLEDIDALVDAIAPINSNFALLHCVSTYPNTDENLNLLNIVALRNRYPGYLIGFSSHHPGIDPLKHARTLGASIFEAHFTLNRSWKGTDNAFSLEPRAMDQAVEDVRRVDKMLGTEDRILTDAERIGFVHKMGKGVYLRRPLPAGSVIKKEDLVIMAPAGGLRPDEADSVVGRSLISDLSTGIPMERGMVNG